MLTKSELIKKIAIRVPGLKQQVIETCANTIVESMVKALCEGKRIELRGFGSFSLRHRAPRQARNPKTGEKVFTEAKYAVHFKPGKELRQAVDNSKNIPIAE